MKKQNHRITFGVGLFLIVALAIIYGAIDYSDIPRSSIATPAFDGRYDLISKESFRHTRHELAKTTDPRRRKLLESILTDNEASFADFRINHGVITCGHLPTQSVELQNADISKGELRGKAIWHEDIHDPGDMSVVPLRLKLEGNRLEFRLGGEATGSDQNFDTVVLRKRES